MIRYVKPKYRCQDKVSDWQPREVVATFPHGRERTAKLSGGTDDSRPMTLARINQRNAEFWKDKRVVG